MARTKRSLGEVHVQSDREIVITRIFDAPRSDVWKAWTEPARLVRWWGPRSFTSPSCALDLRVGGRYLFCMRSPEGRDYWSTGFFREVTPMDRIAYTDNFADEHGNIVPASYYGMAGDWPEELLVTVTFGDFAGKTKMTLRHSGLPSGQMSEMAEAGWDESFDKLEKSVSMPKADFLVNRAERTITMHRIFDAPRELVFKAYTDPTMIPHWWGPRVLVTTVETMDVRPGGRWRFVQRDPHGKVHGFHGVYREVVRPSRLVYTFEYEGTPGHEVVETVTFEEHHGRTKLTSTAQFKAIDELDGMIKSGAEGGARESMERIAEVLNTQTKAQNAPLSIHPAPGNGKICYVEIPAVDINDSASFYREVFGWKIRRRSDGHIAFDDTVGEVSGTWVTGRKPASVEPGLIVYIMVNDIAATLDAIVARGGIIVQPIGADAPEITARFSDPAGNMFGLYQDPRKMR